MVSREAAHFCSRVMPAVKRRRPCVLASPQKYISLLPITDDHLRLKAPTHNEWGVLGVFFSVSASLIFPDLSQNNDCGFVSQGSG